MRESPVDKPAAMQSRRVGDDALWLGDRADDTNDTSFGSRITHTAMNHANVVFGQGKVRPVPCRETHSRDATRA